MSEDSLEEEATKIALSSMADARDHFSSFKSLHPPGVVMIHKDHYGWIAAGVFEFPDDLKDFGETVNYVLKTLDCNGVVIVQDSELEIDDETTSALLAVTITEWSSKAWILPYKEKEGNFIFENEAEALDDMALQGGYIFECITAMWPEIPEGTMLQ